MLIRDYYETSEDTKELVRKFNKQIDFIQIKGLEQEALDVIKQWEKDHGF